jgi:GntR family transcriptional regulator
LPDSGKQTRWEEVAADLTAAIAAGRFPVGTDLPSEADLCAEYAVSRFTVREALRRLADSGLIVRRHGSGSRVTAASPRQAYAFTVGSELDVLRYAAETTMKLSSRVTSVSRQAALELPLEEPSEWVKFAGLRESPAGERIALVDVYVRAEHAAIVSEIEQPVRRAIYAQLLQQLGLKLSSIEQTIGATTLTAVQARRLAAEDGEPALRIIRCYYGGDQQLIEVSVQVHPASRFEYSVSIKPMHGTPGFS